MATTNDEAVGLFFVTQFLFFLLAGFKPRLARLGCAMFNTLAAGCAFFLLMALEFNHGGEQRPCLAIFQPHQPAPARRCCFKREPRLRHGLITRSLAFQFEVGGFHGFQGRLQHVGDLLLALNGFDIPCIGHQIAPVTLLVKQCERGGNIAVFLRGFEIIEPGRGAV